MTVKFSVPSPSLNIIGSPRDMEFFQGLDLTLTCTIEVNPAVDSSVKVQSSWQRNETDLNNSNSRITISNATIVMLPSNYQATLRFNPMDLDDADIYYCTVDVMPQNETFIIGTTTSAVRNITDISSELM